MQTAETLVKPWASSRTATFDLPPEQSTGTKPEMPSLNIPLASAETLLFLSSLIAKWASTVGTHAISHDVERLLIHLIDSHVRLVAPDQIRRYLRSCPDLIELVPVAIEAARKHLQEAELTLQVYHDPEFDDAYLALYVRVKEYDESVMERIERAESEFIDVLTDKSGWLQITTDFKEPEEIHGL